MNTKNRIKILGLVLLVGACLATAKSQESNMVVKFKNGTCNVLKIKSIKNMSFYSSMMNINSLDGSNVVYANADVQKMYFENVTAVPTVNNKLDVFAYPNPTSGLIYFKGLTDQSVTLQLFNLSGVQVFAGRVNASVQSIDISFLPRGIYLLNMNNQIEKLIKL